MNTITIAAAQSCSTKGDIDANVGAHAKIVRVAAEHHVDLVVFPELSLTGYEPEIATVCTIDAEDERLDPLKALA